MVEWDHIVFLQGLSGSFTRSGREHNVQFLVPMLLGTAIQMVKTVTRDEYKERTIKLSHWEQRCSR